MRRVEFLVNELAINELKNAALKAESENLWLDAAFLYDEIFKIELSSEALSKSGWCYSRAGKFAISAEKFLLLNEMESNSAKCLYMIGYQFYSLKNWQEAVLWYEKALKQYSDYFVVKYRLGYAYLQIAGAYKKLTKPEYWRALGQFQECHELWENFSIEEKKKNGNYYADVCFQHGKALLQLDKKINEAIDYLQRSLEIRENIDCKYELAKAFYLKGDFQMAYDNLPLSRKYYVIELKCQINYELGNYNCALNDLLSLMQNRKKDYLYILLAKIYQKTNRSKMAYSTLIDCLRISRDNHKVYFELAKICFSLRLFSEAKRNVEKAIILRREKFSIEYPEATSLLEIILQSQVTDEVDDHAILECSMTSISNSGVICSYKSDKGFGFIRSDNRDIFFHISKCNFKDVIVGCKVEFEVENGDRGLAAINVKKV